jgi:hypothetical protein
MDCPRCGISGRWAVENAQVVYCVNDSDIPDTKCCYHLDYNQRIQFWEEQRRKKMLTEELGKNKHQFRNHLFKICYSVLKKEGYSEINACRKIGNATELSASYVRRMVHAGK